VTAKPVFQYGEPPVLFKRSPNASVHASTPDLNLFLVGMLIAASEVCAGTFHGDAEPAGCLEEVNA
jgi:hypothetical protein